MSGEERRNDGGAPGGGGGGERRPYRAPTSFNCDEVGHYANQCPHRNRRPYSSARPSTSADSRRSRSPRRYDHWHRTSPSKDAEMRAQVAEMGWNYAIMKEHYDMERKHKEEKARRKQEKEEAKRLEVEEKERQERKAKKKMEKLRKEAEQRAELSKDLRMQMKMDMFQLRDVMREEFVEQIREVMLPKRKREPETHFEGSPPMELPPKRTPKRGVLKLVKLCARLTRSKAKGAKKPGLAKKGTPVKTPLSGRKAVKTKTPVAKSTTAKGPLVRIRYMNRTMKELKDLDATELKRICKEVGVHYDKKVNAIFDIAEHRARLNFREEQPAEEAIMPVESETSEVPPEEELE
ncbi:hypothetical protein CBR_g38947 [Chara braunii]|uniref:CCHC-type domain-containing protein n=1 Tax=Chara braunii TaxID=69332 RepID=A0A388K0U1_CHABU|nr:hypothetical protein CBR_g38947 [Chara braunii]|eukprot:GBG63636.1 hypothetical protein CBR_g38947 [Chara braunii]